MSSFSFLEKMRRIWMFPLSVAAKLGVIVFFKTIVFANRVFVLWNFYILLLYRWNAAGRDIKNHSTNLFHSWHHTLIDLSWVTDVIDTATLTFLKHEIIFVLWGNSVSYYKISCLSSFNVPSYLYIAFDKQKLCQFND